MPARAASDDAVIFTFERGRADGASRDETRGDDARRRRARDADVERRSTDARLTRTTRARPRP
jgi:hypothetical protein